MFITIFGKNRVVHSTKLEFFLLHKNFFILNNVILVP